MKVLIFGNSGSGKTTLAEPLAEKLKGVWINADAVRAKAEDWDFSIQGRVRQMQRISMIADGVQMANKIAICDFICPMRESRKEFAADFVVWMNTIEDGRYDDTNMIFQEPEEDDVDYIVTEWSDDTVEILTKLIKKKKLKIAKEKKND
jgi:adenylylsulfate kinase